VIPALGKGRQEDHKFEDSLGYTISSMEGRKEGKKEGRKEGKMEGRKEEIVILG
jgi:predicted transposase YdaD